MNHQLVIPLELLVDEPAADSSLEDDLAMPPPAPTELERLERLERLFAEEQCRPPARCRCDRPFGSHPDEDGEVRCLRCGHLPREASR